MPIKTSVKKAPFGVAPRGKPQTMEELLNQTSYKFPGFKRGQVVEAVVVEKTGKAIYFDIGGKSEGAVIDREMKAARDFIKALKVGDKVTAVVTQAENESGHTILSLKKASQDIYWQKFEERLKTGEVIKVKGLEVNKGGLVVAAGGVDGFIPTSQFSAALSGKISELPGKQIEAKVIEVDRASNRLILSEKEVSEAGKILERQQLLAKIKAGEVLAAVITGTMPFGLFVMVKVPPKSEVEGLVHISEISWEKVEDPARIFKVGQGFPVKVLGVDKTGKLNLSIKQLTADPWEKIEQDYPVETRVKGEVVRIAPFGAFVRLKPGIEALIHTSKIPAGKTFKVGEKVDCFIESVDKAERKMSLGMVLTSKPVGYK